MSISALSDLSDAVVAPVALNESLLDLLLIDGAMATLKRAADGRPVWASPSWQDWVGGEVPLPQPVASAIQAADARALASGQPMSVDDHVFERADGRRVELRALRRVLHGLAGEPLLGQIVANGVRMAGDDTAYANLIKRHWFEESDFMPYRRRMLAERRNAWIAK